ncbi:hypothetical protein V5799_015585 [Amblyomma americanum]|uniref:Uncharacterized protein n=1 Tax=Amblyomma americanum TaxID=6943 RepID=A0AAQ4F7D3_AMBAM
MENMAQAHKKTSTAGTGSAATQCPFYRLLHTFLGNLPMNDRSLVQESFQLDMVERLPRMQRLLPQDRHQKRRAAQTPEMSRRLTSLASPSEASTSQASTPAASAEQGRARKSKADIIYR